MAVRGVIEGLHRISEGGVNSYLIDDSSGGLVLVDTGYPDKANVVLDALAALKRDPRDVRHIVLTHAHIDHIGSLAALKAATGAETWMHGADAPLAENGGPFRPVVPARELLPKIVYWIVARKEQPPAAPAPIDHVVADGDLLPMAGGLRVIHVPGHCAGQIALLWGRVLIAGDACMTAFGLSVPICWEDEVLGRVSLKRLTTFDYDSLCCGHGKPIVRNASAKMRRKWG